jgi:hypothetical protein
LSGFQSPISNVFETIRVPGFNSRSSFGRSFRLICGSRNKVTTVASWNAVMGTEAIPPSLASKTRYSFRYVTQLDPLDYLAFTALIYEVGPQLEVLRRPAADKFVYSWRFAAQPDDQMYDAAYRWSSFTDRCQEMAEMRSCRWVVVADIADFFPHIYVHPVERALDTATNGSPQAYCLLRFIRNWNAFVSYGLPVGVAASRIADVLEKAVINWAASNPFAISTALGLQLRHLGRKVPR